MGQTVQLLFREVIRAVGNCIILEAEVVEVAVGVLNEALGNPLVVLIVPLLAVFVVDAVLNLGDHDLAVRANHVVAGVEQNIAAGMGQTVQLLFREVIRAVGNCIILEAEVVEVAVVVLDKTLLYLNAVFVVVQLTAFLIDTVLQIRNHNVSICVDMVGAGSERGNAVAVGIAVELVLREVVVTFAESVEVMAEVVVQASLIANKTLLFSAVLTIVVEVAVNIGNTLRQDHIAVRVEIIISGGNRTGHIQGAVVRAVDDHNALASCIVPEAVQLEQTGMLRITVNHINLHAEAAVKDFRTGAFLAVLVVSLVDALIREDADLHGNIVIDQAETLVAIAVFVESVGFSVDFRPHTVRGLRSVVVVVVRTVVVFPADAVVVPFAVGQLAGFVERVGDFASVVGFYGREGLRIEVIEIILNLDPATLQNVVDCIVVFAVALEQSCAGVERLAADVADELTVHELPVMAGGRNGGAPVHNGLTGFTISSAGVAGLRAGCSLIREGRQLGVMDVPQAAGLIAIHLSCNAEASAEGHIIIHKAIDKIRFNLEDGFAVFVVARSCAALRRSAVTAEKPIFMPEPDANGD